MGTIQCITSTAGIKRDCIINRIVPREFIIIICFCVSVKIILNIYKNVKNYKGKLRNPY